MKGPEVYESRVSNLVEICSGCVGMEHTNQGGQYGDEKRRGDGTQNAERRTQNAQAGAGQGGQGGLAGPET